MRLFLLSLLLLTATSAVGLAQAPQGTEERALARSLFHQGLECLDAEDLPCAAERFTRSHDLRPSPVVAYNLASVLARLGRVVHAAELLRWVLRAPNANDQVKAAATALLPQVTPRIAHWTLRAEGAVGRVRFFLDGRALPEQIVGSRAPVDPGEHRVEARRDGEAVAESTFSVAERGRAEVTLDIPEPTVPTATETAEQAEGGEPRVITVVRERPVDPAVEARARRRRRGVGIGLAVALVAGAIVLGVLLHEPDPAQPIPGNLTPAVVELGE